MVVDKFGDNPNSASKAHLYTKTDSRTYTFRGVRSSNGSYEVKSVFNPNLCFTMAGGLNPNQGNGILAVFSGDCNNSLNLRFYDDGTIRVARNTNLCLTNQGNRYNTPLNKLHFWACDGSAETKWNVAAVGQPTTYNPPVVTQPTTVQPQASTNTTPVPINQYNTVSQNDRILPGGNTNGGGPSGIDRMITCFVFGYYIPLKYVPGFACNQLIINMNARSLLQFPNYLPLSWEQASGICNKVGGNLEWRNNTKMCFKK
jgi:hypothetical protein